MSEWFSSNYQLILWAFLAFSVNKTGLHITSHGVVWLRCLMNISNQVNITWLYIFFSTANRNIDLGVRIDTTSLSSAVVECSFFQPLYNCTIDYGTDPSYTNLEYQDTSSTLGRIAIIRLLQILRPDTVYYYVVSAVSNSQCVRVQGRFRAGGHMSFIHLTIRKLSVSLAPPKSGLGCGQGREITFSCCTKSAYTSPPNYCKCDKNVFWKQMYVCRDKPSNTSGKMK